MAEQLTVRKLLLDGDAGLIPRLERALQHERYQSRFQLTGKALKINFKLGEMVSKISGQSVPERILVTQRITLSVEVETDASNVQELNVLSAQFQNAVDLQISSWYSFNHRRGLDWISDVQGTANSQDVRGGDYLGADLKMQLIAKRIFEFRYSEQEYE
ncbi:hypothetical protein H6G00_00955 [Leptolyngbya sp. FACHB-541]|uniref:hypothetical protein n=1 Tax=Leptolyngbya sp. FACHB-541 TaxID=2692810 RepID=UPI0016876B2C|nr:hypothetical protein [Leptolyngbya sp. FACHB-541]MBD1995197.1 hypothetical protein [Leptolyngbya sp. FACHB-541]